MDHLRLLRPFVAFREMLPESERGRFDAAVEAVADALIDADARACRAADAIDKRISQDVARSWG